MEDYTIQKKKKKKHLQLHSSPAVYGIKLAFVNFLEVWAHPLSNPADDLQLRVRLVENGIDNW